MFEELSDILRSTVGPEVLSSMAGLTNALEKHNAVLYKDRINQLRMEANNIDRTVIGDQAIAIVFGQVNALFQQMHITINTETVSIDRISGLLDALLFEPSDDDDEILRLIDAEEDSHEAFVQIVGIKMNVDPAEIIDMIVEVDPECIYAIQEKLLSNLRSTDNAVEGVKEAVVMVNKHANLFGKATIGLESLNSGVGFANIDPQVVIEARKDELLSMQPTELAEQLISICLLGGVTVEEMQEEVMTYAESLLHDPFMIQKVYRTVNDRLIQLRNAQ